MNAQADQRLARKEEAARLLAERSYTHREIGRLIGVSRETVSRWATKDPVVVRLVDEFRKRGRGGPEPGAVAVLKSLLLSDDERVRLAAASKLIDLRVERIAEPAEPLLRPEAPAGYAVVAMKPLPSEEQS